MRRNETLDDLTPAQALAIEALLAGKSQTAAAEAASVARSTLHRWRNDPAFVAALNRGKREAYEAARDRLEGLADQAVAVVAQALATGDGKVALAVLKGLGLLPEMPPAAAPESAAEVIAKEADKAIRDPHFQTYLASL